MNKEYKGYKGYIYMYGKAPESLYMGKNIFNFSFVIATQIDK